MCILLQQYYNITQYWINFDSGKNYYAPWSTFPWGEDTLTDVWTYATYRQGCQNAEIPQEA